MTFITRSVLCLVLAIGLHQVTCKATEHDYFLLVREWLPTACAGAPCNEGDASRFTIHGLWPERLDGTWPEYCSSAPFSEDAITDLLPELHHEWPSVFNSDPSFWAHEWRRHGTCATHAFPDEHAFFSAVLKLHARFDLDASMAAAGIDTDVEYTAVHVTDALSAALGHRIAVHCSHADAAAEVWMCIGLDLQAFDCPANVLRPCPAHVTFPAGTAAAGIGAAWGGPEHFASELSTV